VVFPPEEWGARGQPSGSDAEFTVRADHEDEAMSELEGDRASEFEYDAEQHDSDERRDSLQGEAIGELYADAEAQNDGVVQRTSEQYEYDAAQSRERGRRAASEMADEASTVVEVERASGSLGAVAMSRRQLDLSDLIKAFSAELS